LEKLILGIFPGILKQKKVIFGNFFAGKVFELEKN
jgi:hypothetical protein